MTKTQILLHPLIPKPLHGIAPRVILGKEWWDKNRQLCYKNANYKCEACGVSKYDAKYHKWLEAHEFYDFNWETKRLKLIKLIALCHSCHNFIHIGRLQLLVDSNEISQSKFNDIYNHGINLIKKANLMNEYQTRNKDIEYDDWTKWKMDINGQLYGPSTLNYNDWRKGYWRNWKP